LSVSAANVGDMADEVGGQAAAEGRAIARPIGWWPKEAGARIDAAFDRALDGSDTDRRGWQVMSSLARQPCRETEVAEALAAFDPPLVVHEVVAQLESHGWVIEQDGVLCLTEEGTRQHAAIAPLVDEIRRQVSVALSPEDYRTLVRLLRQLVESGVGHLN